MHKFQTHQKGQKLPFSPWKVEVSKFIYFICVLHPFDMPYLSLGHKFKETLSCLNVFKESSHNSICLKSFYELGGMCIFVLWKFERQIEKNEHVFAHNCCGGHSRIIQWEVKSGWED